MAVAAYAIPSLAEVKSYLKIGDTTSDTILEVWIDRVSHGIEKYCQRKFAVQSITSEIHDGMGDERLYVNFWPVTQLSTETTPNAAQKLAALQFRDTPDDAWEDIEDDVDHIFLNADRPYIELYDRFFPLGRQNIRISYKAGFTVIPGEVWQVALEMVAEMWNNSKQSGQDRLGRSTRSMGQFTDSFRSLRPEWKEVLERYRVYSILV
jgi:hypothetical protein